MIDTDFVNTTKIMNAVFQSKITITNVKIRNSIQNQFEFFESEVKAENLDIEMNENQHLNKELKHDAIIKMNFCNFKIKHSTFKNGYGDLGGALKIQITPYTGSFLLENNTFESNIAISGGAVYAEGGVIVNKCKFKNNTGLATGSDIHWNSINEST